MNNTLTCHEVFEFYAEFIQATHSPQQATRILNEFRCAFFRYFLPELGFERTQPGKMTKAESERAKEFLKTLTVKVLLKARQTLQQAFLNQNASRATRNTYGSRFNQFLLWGEQQPWWPNSSKKERVINQCCLLLKNPHGAISKTPLTERRTAYLSYMLEVQDTPVGLQQELDKLHGFFTQPEWPGRVNSPIEESTAQTYLKDIRLMLGWFCRYRTPSIALEEIRLSHLFPFVPLDELEGLTIRQQEKLWKQHKQALETWLLSYFRFLREVLDSKSPHTRRNKLCSLVALGKFLYAGEVEEEADYYRQIPLFKVPNNLLSKNRKEITEWVNNQESVSDFDRKWPDTSAGETALFVVRAKIVEPLRLECRPRTRDGKFRQPWVIAKSLQSYVKWSLLSELPARRQQEYRTTRIALSCPITKPPEVPIEGLYHPLPPTQVREKRWDGSLNDNYLYKTYVHNKTNYPQGIWVLDVQRYKTRKTHAAQSIVIPNPDFADGSCFYDYLERYLYGWFLAEGYKNVELYDWWQPELRGRRGRWVSFGRADFNPGDACCLPKGADSELWSWGYLFVVPKLGTPPDGPSFSSSIESTAHRLIGKRITPHTMRYIWATWAYQVGLDDAQLRSLAYAMGHTVEVLRQMYVRCTPQEKRRPIEEAISQLRLEPLPGQSPPKWDVLLQQVQLLSPADREQFIAKLTQ